MSERELTSEELDELQESAVDALLVLSYAAEGDCSTQVDVDMHGSNPLSATFASINELIFALGAEQEQSAIFRRDLEDKLEIIEQQRSAIQSLSTPIIEVWRGVLCLPVVGVMDTARAAEMTTSLLEMIVSRESRYAVIDITGIDVMDTGTVDHFVRMAKAVRLLGADCALTGLNPHIAQTIVHMGLDLSAIVTHRSLRDALQLYMGAQ